MTNPFAAQPSQPAPPTVNPFAQQVPAPPLAGQPNPFGQATPIHPAAVAAGAVPASVPTQPAPTAAAPDFGDPFSGPAPQQPRGPRLREMMGRLLLMVPIKVEYNVLSQFKTKEGGPVYQDRMTADVIVLDGGQIAYGGKPEARNPTPHDKVADVPLKCPAMYVSAVGLVSQCRDAYAKHQQGQPGMVLGRLTVGPQGSDSSKEPPWLLTPPNDQDAALARAYLAANPIEPFSRA